MILELELKKAKSAPVIVNGETINLNEGQKTETNFAQTLSMVPTGTAGKLSRGAGSMALEAE